MLTIEKIVSDGWEAAIRGMRNPKNSWYLSDSKWIALTDNPTHPHDFRYELGPNDLDLCLRLNKAGSEHRKFVRMIHISFDVVAPIFWWAEHDTYKVATTRNSCSKMHKIHVKPFSMDDFSHEGCDKVPYAKAALEDVIRACEHLRQDFNETGNRECWRALIELLPEGYNMRATWDGSLETLLQQCHQRNGHKLKEEWEPYLAALFENIPYLGEYYDALYGKKSVKEVDENGN